MLELAAGLCDRYGDPKDGRRLERYSEVRLPRVWRHQEFSNLMLSLFNAGVTPGDHRDSTGFSYGLRRARLDQIVHDPQFSRWFARAYVGVDD